MAGRQTFSIIFNGSQSNMTTSFKIATLLYCFNDRDEVLLLERAQEPNLGLWSPSGGKLKTDLGESPYACACREAMEEMNFQLTPGDLHLTGIVSEKNYQGQSHWLMFLFEVKKRLNEVPPAHREGRFAFFKRAELSNISLPTTDAVSIWPLFWKNRGGFFAAHCDCLEGGENRWTMEQGLPLE